MQRSKSIVSRQHRTSLNPHQWIEVLFDLRNPAHILQELLVESVLLLTEKHVLLPRLLLLERLLHGQEGAHVLLLLLLKPPLLVLIVSVLSIALCSFSCI